MRGQTGKLIKLDRKIIANINEIIRCTPLDKSSINKAMEISIVVKVKLK